MCIIIDTNVVEDMNEPSEDGAIVLKWMLTGKGGMVVGGATMRKELGRSKKMLSTIAVLSQAGRLRNVDDAKVDALANKLAGACSSNDSHVVAVVIESGCRLVFTRDKPLHKDLQDKDIVTPAASIYQNKTHKHLLKECRC